MALSMLNRLAPSAIRRTVARKPTGLRKYGSHAHGHHATGPVEKSILRTRVVFPSPLGRSNVSGDDAIVAAAK